MRGKGLALAFLMAGCAASPLPMAEPPPAPAVAAIPPAPAVPPPVVAVVKAYQAARRKELPAISVPGVTAGYINNINTLEIAAGNAVRRLVRRGVKLTPDALAAARSAVSALDTALAASPPSRARSPPSRAQSP